MRARTALETFAAITLACALGCQREPSDRSSSGADTSRAEAAPVARTRSTGGVSGTTSFDGAGVEGAEVCALWRGARVRAVREDVTRRCTKTDAAGQYAFELPVGVWLLVASAWGFLPDSEALVRRAGQSRASLDFGLRRGGSARAGTVVDLDGSPIAGIRVAARMPLGGRPGYATSVRTNAQGQFELWADDDASLRVNSPGYIELVVHESGTYTALPESVIDGRVIDAAGKPVAGARVANVGLGDPPLGVPESATLTDAEGRFRLGKVKPGNYSLMAFRDDLGGTKQVSAEFARTHADIEIVVTPSLEWLRAQVVETSGEPVAGCLVGLTPASDDPGSPTYTFWTDEEGGLDFPTRPGSRYDIEFLHCPGRVGKPPYGPLFSGRIDGEVSRLEVAPGRVLRGRVIDTEGRPLVHVKVFVDPLAANLPGGTELLDPSWNFMTLWGDATTDAQGWFEIGGLFPGTLEVEVRVEGWRRSGPPQRVTMTDHRTTEASFTLEDSARLELRSSEVPLPPAPVWPKTVVHVVDPTGQDVAKAVVSVFAGEARLTSTDWWDLGALAITDALGRASFEPGCNKSFGCTLTAARPGMFGTATVQPGHSGEIVIAIRPSGP